MTPPRFAAAVLSASAGFARVCRGVVLEVLNPAAYRMVAARARHTVAAVLVSYTLLNLGLTAVLSQLLGSRRFGEYAVVLTIAGVFRLLASFAVEAGVPKFIAESGERDPARMRAYYAAGLAIRLTAGLGAFCLAAALAHTAARLYGVPHLGSSVTAAALYLCLLSPLASFFLGCIQGREQPRRWATTTLINAAIVFPAAVIGALGMARWGLPGLLFSMGIGWAIAACSSAVLARRAMGFTWAAPDRTHLRLLLLFLAPLWLGDLISQGAHIILKSYMTVHAGPVAVGQFEIALTLLLQFGTVYSAIMIVFVPTWARLYATQQGAELLQSFSLARGAIIGMASVFGFGLALAGQWIVPLLFGREQTGAVAAVRVLGLIMPLIFSSWVTLSTFVISNRTSVSARANILWFLIVVPIGILLIPGFGSLGGSLAFVVGYVAFTSYVVIRARPFFAMLQGWAQREAESSVIHGG